MEASKLLLLLLLLFSIAFSKTGADAVIEDDVAVETESTDSKALQLELDQLRSKISALESSIADRTRELASKDDTIAQFEKIIQEKSESIGLLHKEIETIQKKGAVDAAELLEKAHARAAVLEKQAEGLQNDLKIQTQAKDALEARVSRTEKKIEELTSKLETLRKTNDEQKRRIQKTERALKVAEENLMKTKLEAASKKKELAEIHVAWLPPWLASHLGFSQEFLATRWNQHGKPTLDSFIQKASDLSARAQKQAEPYLDTVKDKWLPAVKVQWTTFLIFIKCHAQRLSTKAVEFYEASVTTLKPHVVRVQELADPYYQEAKKFSKPYIDQVATATEPLVEKVRVALKPYTKKAVRAYGKFLKSAKTYHHQVQAFTRKNLKKYELTKALVTNELVWFLASAFLAMPGYLAYLFFTSVFCKKTRKPTRTSHASHTQRRHKRRHADK